MMDLLGDLNEQQRVAVLHASGPLLVVAGPGTGKTRVITRRIAHRIDAGGVRPDRLLGVTFTNRAAEEMKRRIGSLLGADANVHLGTFHWTCSAILRRHIHWVGYRRDFRLLGPGEARHVLGDVYRDRPVRERMAMAQAISAIKNGLADDSVARHHRVDRNDLHTVLERYQRRLREMNALDLDDLLAVSVQLLQQEAEVRRHCCSAHEEILVDEYQDVNPVQRQLVRLLAPENASVTAVGDEDQAIYSWRQADSRGMGEFPSMFPGTAIVTLSQTYRSSKHILRAATNLIGHNGQRLPKKLQTSRPAGTRPMCFQGDDEVEEADWIAAEILNLAEPDTLQWERIAVLYRINAQSRAIEDALVRRSIPYRIFSGARFYDRPEIRTVMYFLRLAVDEGDEDAAKALLLSTRGIGPRRIEALVEQARARDEPLLAFTRPATADRLPPRIRGAVDLLISRLNGVRKVRMLQVSTVVDSAIDAALAHLGDSGDTLEEAVEENLDELRSVVREFEARRGTTRGLIDRLTLGAEPARQSSAVTLMSLHASKGLEFPIVFLAGMEEGLLPHRRSFDEPGDIEEERRLCYVGMTRAEDRLYLSYARSRLLGGAAGVAVPSRFLFEIGSAHMALVRSQRTDAKPRLHRVALGERVSHARWDSGTVISVEGSGRDTLVTIAFDAAGTQRLQLCHAPLTRLTEESPDVLAG